MANARPPLTYPIVTITPDPGNGGGGGGAGTGDHRDLTHRNDANQHTGDAVKVTATWPGDSEASDKTLTEGTAAIIAAMASGGATLWADLFGAVDAVDGSTMTVTGFNYADPGAMFTTEAVDGDLILRLDPEDVDKRLRLWIAHDGDPWEPVGDLLGAGQVITLTGKHAFAGGGWMGQGQFVTLAPGSGLYPLPGLQWLPVGGDAARYIAPYIAFGAGPSTDAFWASAPPGILMWVFDGRTDTEGRWPSGFYRTNGTDTPDRATEYDETVPTTIIHVRGSVITDARGLIENDFSTTIGQNLLWVLHDWSGADGAQQDPPVGATANGVITTYQPDNYEVDTDLNSIEDHLAGIDNAIGEQFLDSVYVPTSGPLVDLVTGMELEVETPEVLTLTGNTVHVRSVDQDHTGKTILVECTLVDQHDRSGRRLKGFEMVGTASDAYSFALTLHFASLTPLDGSAWQNGHREDIGIYIGFSGKAVAGLHPYDGHPFSRSAQFTSPIPSNDLDDHRISIIVSTGPNPTFNGVIETEFEIVPVWEDANEAYTPAEASQWEDLTGDVPESKTEALDKLMAAVAGGPFLIDGVALDSESGFWGQLFDLFGATTGTWDNPEFPDGNSISLATPSVEQQTLGYTAKWKLNLSPLNRGQGLKGLHFSGAGVEGGDCAWLVTDASDVAVAGGEWDQGRKVDPGSDFGFPGKAIVAVDVALAGSLTDMYFDNVIYPEEGEPFYLQLAMSHFESPYEGVMSVDLIVTPIWEDANESYSPGQPSTWEDLDGDVPETKKEALDTLIGVVSGLTSAVDAKVADAINDGTTTVAPSQNAVFDALALKGDLVATHGFRLVGNSVRDYCIPGEAIVTGTSTVAPSSNRCQFERWRLRSAQTFDRVAMEVTAAGGAGKLIRMSVWSVDGYGQPAALIADFGTIDANSATFQALTISLTLPAGDYIGVWVSDGSPTVRTVQTQLLGSNALAGVGSTTPIRNQATFAGSGIAAGGFPSTPGSAVTIERDLYTGFTATASAMRLREAA